ncbi:MAG: TetR/AcrR family transcriptional regulator [Chloroflexi bacterium]|nr:MAG: TetR/AcrR family transcriptional regulator [Chloroflexota bacterium]
MITEGRSTTREEHRRLRGQRLLEAVLEVIAREGPAVSMERLASELGVTKPILYRYFDDRAGLYRAVARATLDRLMADLQAALAQPAETRQLLTEVVDAYLTFIEREPQLSDAAAAEAWAYGVVGMVQLAGDWWLERRPMPRPRLVAYLVDLLWNGFANRG